MHKTLADDTFDSKDAMVNEGGKLLGGGGSGTIEEIILGGSHIAKRGLDALNDAFQRDPKAIWTLMNAYTPCNEALADHPTVQVISREADGEEKLSVGILGLLNGVIEAMSGFKICSLRSEPDENGQMKLLGFDVYSAEKYPPAEETV